MHNLPQTQRPFFVHCLGLDRYFWAIWENEHAFHHKYAPRAYGTSEENEEELRSLIEKQFTSTYELQLELPLKKALYRQIRRMELPEHIRKEIDANLKLKATEHQKYLAKLGFESQDLDSLTNLQQKFRELAYLYHPDHGGTPETFYALNAAYRLEKLRLQSSDSKID